MAKPRCSASPLDLFAPPVAAWFRASFDAPTRAQELGWPAIASGESTLILAPTGSGKTLSAFLWCINRIMVEPLPVKQRRCRVLYISPLKALALDVERNLRAPIVGISNMAAAHGVGVIVPEVAIRTGDTPPKERARFQKSPADILITTPESLYLILTSNARESLRSIETVIVDEIHSLVPTKRGAHLALSLERLEELCARSPQRIGLSATQRPLDEVARFLGGATVRKATRSQGEDVASESLAEASHEALAEFEETDAAPTYRPVTIIDTGERKKLEVRIEVPVEDMARLDEPEAIPSGPASRGPVKPSIWPAIHPRLIELIRAHRTTLLFVNSRRLAERLAGSLNELAGENLVAAHHGSLAREQRVEVEDDLKMGRLRALVATSSLELGIDMGSVDLVVQIEAPPSVASGMQRIGRAGHQVDSVSEGIVFPKHRGDLLACAAATRAMHEGQVEETRYPRNPLDVLAQQIVAAMSLEQMTVDTLFAMVRRAAPYADLSRGIFENLLDMLSGLYPSDDFAELRPRINWDRVANVLGPRAGAKRVAILNGGTIPDRGLYGVFLAGAEKGKGRVGELDEEMVFEADVGETFVLGASTWRIEEITRDRVIVTPAPGEPGKMPFWHGDRASRPVEFGRRIGALAREVRALPKPRALALLERQHGLDRLAAQNLLQYLDDQTEAAKAVPDDRTLLVERVRDELGDWLVCVLSPLGGRVMAPWAMAVMSRIRRELALEVEAMWSDDGFIIRFPETDEPPAVELVIPAAEEVEQLLIAQLAGTSLFAARFREAAARALLLPRRAGRDRTPLWRQRKRAWDLMQVASKFGSFPIFLETYRECLRDVFDLPALVDTLRSVEKREIRVAVADTDRPSPFAGSLLFRYVANFLYDGDAPLAERRAQALAIDQAQLRELLGEAELRELLDPESLSAVESRLQRLDEELRATTPDGVHDLLLGLGDLSAGELRRRCATKAVADAARDLVGARRAVEVHVAGERRFIAIEDVARYRDALGIPLPAGVPAAFLKKTADPLRDLVLRFARTRGPFTVTDAAERFGLGHAIAESALHVLVREGRLVEGEFRPDGTQREFCHEDVLRRLRRQSLAKLRREIEPVEPRMYARMLAHWQGVAEPRKGLGALLEAIETLQGAPIAASVLEAEILPARVADYLPTDLDHLVASGAVVWCGIEPLGEHDGRIALYLREHFVLLRRSSEDVPPTSARASGEGAGAEPRSCEDRIVDYLTRRGASFFEQIHEGVGGGFQNETLDAIWNLVWEGRITNDSLHALRAYAGISSAAGHAATVGRLRKPFAVRRIAPRGSEGRWALVESATAKPTERAAALAHQLLARYGIVSKDAAGGEAIRGGFSAVYDVLKAMEDAGRIRRGYFVGGIAAGQFAQPGAIDLLRSLKDEPEKRETIVLAATDPANPYGMILPWPQMPDNKVLSRSVGARVVTLDGELVAYIYKGETAMQLFLPDDEHLANAYCRELAAAMAKRLDEGDRRAAFVAEINGRPAAEHPLARHLVAEGFVATAAGYQLRKKRVG